MNFDVYKLLCKKLLEMNSDEGVFAHLFLVLEWNLMARAPNCTNLRLGHIEWRNDCLVFFFGKSKGDQTGETSDIPWYVYSNPCKPSICLVLALAKYLFSFPTLQHQTHLCFLAVTNTAGECPLSQSEITIVKSQSEIASCSCNCDREIAI